jgi:hypothetical protein
MGKWVPKFVWEMLKWVGLDIIFVAVKGVYPHSFCEVLPIHQTVMFLNYILNQWIYFQ